MDIRSIGDEIKMTVNCMMEAKESVLHPDWITTRIMGNHPDVGGNDADFALVGCRAFVRNEVRKQINKIKSVDDGNQQEQLVMPGYEHLQQYYACERDSERCAVRADMMTDDELQAKAQEYRAMGRTCFEHADEIDRYVADRQNSEGSKAV